MALLSFLVQIYNPYQWTADIEENGRLKHFTLERLINAQFIGKKNIANQSQKFLDLLIGSSLNSFLIKNTVAMVTFFYINYASGVLTSVRGGAANLVRQCPSCNLLYGMAYHEGACVNTQSFVKALVQDS